MKAFLSAFWASTAALVATIADSATIFAKSSSLKTALQKTQFLLLDTVAEILRQNLPSLGNFTLLQTADSESVRLLMQKSQFFRPQNWVGGDVFHTNDTPRGQLCYHHLTDFCVHGGQRKTSVWHQQVAEEHGKTMLNLIN